MYSQRHCVFAFCHQGWCGVGLKNLLNKSHHDDAFNVKRISYQAEKKVSGLRHFRLHAKEKNKV